jgi:hypothetical protein
MQYLGIDRVRRGARRMTKLRVVIADDQPMMRAGFKAALEATGNIEVVAEAGTGEEARTPRIGWVMP